MAIAILVGGLLVAWLVDERPIQSNANTQRKLLAGEVAASPSLNGEQPHRPSRSNSSASRRAASSSVVHQPDSIFFAPLGTAGESSFRR